MQNDKKITKRYSRILALNLGLALTSTTAFAAQGVPVFFGTSINNSLTAPAATAVPAGFNPVTGMAATLDDVVDERTGTRKMTVHQEQDKAIASWDSFDIGENSWVYFEQQGHTDWQALNRIYDANPSQIFGRLTADGQVYLINQNGILFGTSANVNVHGLVASALNLDDDAFLNLTKTGAVTFGGSENYDPENQPDWQPGSGFVYNQGFISVELIGEENGKAKVIRDGSVFLVGPDVSNSGTIVAPYGQIGLAAGQQVTLSAETDSSYQNEKYVSHIDTPGQALNEESGSLVADNGRVGMYGRVVNQAGMIRSVTSVWHRGAIELRATEKVVTGKNSQTLAPVTASEEKTGEDFVHRPGEIYIGGIGRGTGLATGVVEHHGTIAADSGKVEIFATDRAYFGAGSLIDVSGAWTVRDGADQWYTQEMNTAQLKDDQWQKKDGSLLYRSEVTINELFGSAIGDFSETYATDQLTSLQKASTGGNIRVEVPEGDIIVRNGASFDISGGGFYHGESTGIGTKLLFGNRIYDLDEAPAYLPYEAFVDSYEKKHERYDITESYSGLYAGGAVPLYDRIPAHLEGHDAGTLTLISRSLAFDGSLIAHAIVGPYQIYDPDLFTDGIIEIDGKQFTERLRRPRSGTLEIGGEATGNYANQSNVLGGFIIADTVEPLPADFAVDSHRDYDTPGYIAASTINDAGLEILTVKSNRQIVVDENAEIRLAAGGELNFESRRIEHRGTIDIPSGSVTMQLRHNYTNKPSNPWYAAVSERLILAGTSRISTAGEQVDQVAALAQGQPVATGVQIDGGTISLRDLTSDTIKGPEQGEFTSGLGQGDGVILAKGALLDVSGGYEIAADGGLKAGNAGELLISGSSVVLEGEVNGHSLAGADGGSIGIYANNIRVEDEVPELYADFDVNDPLPLLDFGHGTDPNDENEQHFRQYSKGLVLADNRFARTGFSRISLNSIYDFVIGDSVQLSVSASKQTSPISSQTGVEVSYVEVPADELGSTAFTITAGDNLDGVVDFDSNFPGQYVEAKDKATLVLPEDSSLTLPVGGTVTLKAPLVTIAGDIKAPAGEISITATNGDLLVTGEADIAASGYISPLPQQEIARLAPVHEVWDAGSITLKNTSSTGKLEIEGGAVVDVSGTEETIVAYTDSGTTLSPLTGAGKAGSITLSTTGGGMSIAPGTLNGKVYFPGMVNGSLTIERNGGEYVVGEDVLDIFRNNDFYQWRLASSNSLVFDHDLELDHDGTLILDTPLLAGKNNSEVMIAADWLQLVNSYSYLKAPADRAELVGGNGNTFTLRGDFIDIQGDFSISGAAAITLSAEYDMALTDRFYIGEGEQAQNLTFYAGALNSTADLTLQADRIYPTVFSDFTIATDKSLTIKPGRHYAGSIPYSAAGSLTLAANRIDHQGYLFAPLGTITMTGIGENSRVMLSPDSLTSVRGRAGMVAFGELNDTGEFWTCQPKEDFDAARKRYVANDDKFIPLLAEDISSAPGKKVILEADEVLVREKAKINLDGGGSIFAYQFLPGLEGTVDPLIKKGQYLLVPGLELPGEVFHITAGNGGLAAGTYTLLPLDESHAENARYAFLPGAYVLIDQGSFTGNMPRCTAEGYNLISGYTGMRGQAVDTRMTRGFALRSAADVLNEGEYATPTKTGGDGGSFELVGRQTTVTAILEGAMQAKALDGYQGGTFTVAAKSVEIGPESFGLDENFVIDDPIPANLQGRLNIKDTTFSGNGFSSVIVGDAAITRSIVMKQDSTIYAENVAFNVGSGYRWDEALGQNVETGGEIILEAGAEVHATQPASGGSGYSEVVFTTDATFHYEPAQEETPVDMTLPGSVTLHKDSLVHAADNITFDTDNLDLLGTDNLQVDHSTLTLKSSRIVFSDAGRGEGESGLFLTGGHWQQFENIEEIRLDSATDILFAGDFSLSGKEELVFDAQRLGGYQQDDFAAVTIAAPHLTLTNTKFAYRESDERQWLPGVTDLAMADSGTDNFLTLKGEEGITLGPGDIRIEGFREVNLRTRGDLALTGQTRGKDDNNNIIDAPSAWRAPGDLNITAARLILDPMDNGAYQAADYLLSAADAVRILPAGGGTSGGAVNRGGRLQVEGGVIDHQGLIDTVDGTVVLSADEVIVGGTVRSVGSNDTPAGSVTIRAQNRFTLEEGGVLDVSAGGQGDAGEIVIDAHAADTLSLLGKLHGESLTNGAAGSFTIDALDLSGSNEDITGFDALVRMLDDGKFFGSLDIRSRLGDITLGADQTVTAACFKLTADGNDATAEVPTGNIHIKGTLDASGEEGGDIELYAMNDLTLEGGSRLLANATGQDGQGGEVYLSTAVKSDAQSPLGYLRMNENSAIDVSGGEHGQGGGVTFRAQRTANNDDVKMELAGRVVGADRITAEGVRLYAYNASKEITAADQTPMLTDATNYANQVKAFSQGNAAVKGVFDHLSTENVSAGSFHHRAGIEVRSSGNLTVKNDWDLKNWRPGGEPVNLTLRAAGSLAINAKIYDKPTTSSNKQGLVDYYNLVGTVSQPSANLNLVAGARTDSADFMAVIKDIADADNTGRLVVADTKKVYTETGDIRFASASDTELGKAAAVNTTNDPTPWQQGRLASTLASFRGNVQGFVGRDLIVKGAIQTATGDIAIRTGGDIRLDAANSLVGAIRTTGMTASYDVVYNSRGVAVSGDIQKFYDYCQGGSISLASGGDITGGVIKDGNNWDKWWESEQKWSAAFNETNGGPLGIATMADGDVQVTAAGNINTQIGTFGKGNLTVSSGLDLNGRFLVAEGLGDLYAQGSFGSPPPDQQDVLAAAGFAYAQVELMDAALSLVTEGDIFLGTVLNPSYARTKSQDLDQVLVGYTPDTSVTLQAVQGDVAIFGQSNYEFNNFAIPAAVVSLLPASLEIEAGHDIIFAWNAGMLSLAPSATGNLSLQAGNDIRSTSYNLGGYTEPAHLRMMQSDPDGFYGIRHAVIVRDEHGDIVTNIRPEPGDDPPLLPLHTGDQAPVTITAGRNIENVRIESAKKVAITAGNDIRDLELRAQNIDAGDLSFVRAGGNIVMGSYERSAASAFYSGFRFAGPGDALVQAGGAISLGTTDGIRSVANGLEVSSTPWGDGIHPNLDFAGANLYVLSGIAGEIAPEEVKGFFDAIRDYTKYCSLISAAVDLEDARQSVAAQSVKDVIKTAKNLVDKADDQTIAALLAGLGADISVAEFKQQLRNDGGIVSEIIEKSLQDFAGSTANLETRLTDLLSEPAVTDIVHLFTLYDRIETVINNSDTSGEAAAAIELMARQEAIAPLVGAETPIIDEKAGISMIQSKIATMYGGDINILTTGNLDVGGTSFTQRNSSTGIKTEFGGDINIFSVGDVNVNESRTMSWMGGDITIWTENDVNAGRGSKTAVNASGDAVSRINENSIAELFKKPSVGGSGIRAVTYDPDGPNGPRDTPEAGDIYLFAKGTIDAGEAGIVGGNIYLMASQVVNAQNITFSQSGVGVPAQSASGINLGALSGAGAIMTATMASPSAAGIADTQKKALQNMDDLNETMVPKVLKVEVIDLQEKL